MLSLLETAFSVFMHLFVFAFYRKIINKRKRFEYKLRRRVKSEEDFINYIDYEMKVLSLIDLRRKVSQP